MATDLLKRLALRALLYPHRLLPAAFLQHRGLRAFGDGTTFGELAERVHRLLGHWEALGLGPGDRVLVDLPNGSAFIEARAACILGGLVAVPVPPATTGDRLAWLAEETAARGYLGPRPPTGARLASIFLDPRRGEQEEYEACLRGARPSRGRAHIRGDDLLTINYTSGTTGEPKGVMSTVAGWGWSLYYALRENRVPVAPGEVFLNAIPLATAGSSLILPALLSGATSLFLDGWDAEEAARLVEEERVTRMFLTPTMLSDFVDAVRARGRDVGSLRSVVYGTEGIPTARIRKALKVLGPVLQQGYGMAEALPPVCLLHPDEHARAAAAGDEAVLSSVGRPTRAVEVGVFGGDDRELPAGQAGSVRVRGRTVSPGYWNRPDLTAATRRGGYYVTGDVGFLDGARYLHVLGREGRIPSAKARSLVEWAEGRPEVQLAWSAETGGEIDLCVVPARGREREAESLAAHLTAGVSLRLHRGAPMTPSYKLAP